MGRRGDRREPEADADPPGSLRLDKWIWFARFQRARETCADLVRKGHVRINGRKVTQPGASVRIGDVLTLALPGMTAVVEVLGIADKREGSEAATRLYRPIEGTGRREAKND